MNLEEISAFEGLFEEIGKTPDLLQVSWLFRRYCDPLPAVRSRRVDLHMV